MTNDEFQKLVLNELKSLKTGQISLEKGQEEIIQRLDRIETKVDGIEERVFKNTEFITGIVELSKNANTE